MRAPLRPNQRNKYLALWEFSRGISDVSSIPPNLQLARSNLCNFKCVYCAEQREGNQVPRSRNEGETWRRLEALIPRANQLAFHGVSEFMIDPKFFDILERCREAGADLSINTNGSVCTPRHVSALADYPGNLTMTFSLDASCAETYQRLRSKDFERTLGNLRTYVEALSGRERRWLSASFVILLSNYREMSSFVRLGKSLGLDSVIFYRLHEYPGLDWRIPARHGGPFDYVAETTRNFPREYNAAVKEAEDTAREIGIKIEVPGLYTDAEIEALGE